MILIRVPAEYGHCYQNSFNFILANVALWESHKIYYTQGVVLSTETYERIGHCWVELVDPDTGEEFCYEPVPHALVPKAHYYARCDAQHVHRYDPEQMIKVALDLGTGPWTEDILDNGLHNGEVRAPEHARALVEKARQQGTIPFEVD